VSVLLFLVLAAASIAFAIGGDYLDILWLWMGVGVVLFVAFAVHDAAVALLRALRCERVHLHLHAHRSHDGCAGKGRVRDGA
jgi:hypothetical protein